MMNKKGQWQLMSPLIVIIGIIALGILLAVFFFSSTVKYTVIGIGIILGGLYLMGKIFTAPGKADKGKMLVALIIMVVGIFFIYGAGNILQTTLPGTYIQAPTFFYYECNAASQPVESTHVNIASGSTNGWVTCPSNTDTCDLWIRQTEQTHWYANDRRIVYQICHNNGANCDPQVIQTTNTPWWNPIMGSIPAGHISNLLTTDKVYINYQAQNLLFQWNDQPNGAEWYHTYKPFILWKVDMFGGGKTEYTSVEQGCNFLSTSGLLNSVSNAKQQIHTQTSTSNTHLDFYKTRNFIGTYVPISTANVNFVTYNGQQGYCLNRQIFAITTAETNGGTYQIVDSNFNTLLSASVTCCPGENEPTRTCNSNFQWEDKTTPQPGQCSAFKACEGASWQCSGSKTQTRYNCINTQCVAETKNVECCSNADCKVNEQCDTYLNKCVVVNPGPITCLPNQTLVNGICVNNGDLPTCGFGQSYYKTQDYGLFGWRKIFNNPIQQSGCKTSEWVYITVFAGIIVILGITYIVVNKPRRRK